VLIVLAKGDHADRAGVASRRIESAPGLASGQTTTAMSARGRGEHWPSGL